ncbi:MAG: hypothetical protein AAB590_03175 [Patescibacteria group bacterium]
MKQTQIQTQITEAALVRQGDSTILEGEVPVIPVDVYDLVQVGEVVNFLRSGCPGVQVPVGNARSALEGKDDAEGLRESLGKFALPDEKFIVTQSNKEVVLVTREK